MLLRCIFGSALLLSAAISIPAQQAPPPAAAASVNDFNSLAEFQVECLPATHADELVGKQGCVAGRVSRVTTTKNGNTHISICVPHQGCPFHASVPRRSYNDVGDLTALRGKLVAFVGPVKLSRGHPIIIIRSRDQVRPTADEPPAEFDSATALPKAFPAKARHSW